MTRREFIDTVNDFYDLVSFCNENGCDMCEDIYDDDERDGMIDEDIRDAVGYDSWRDIRDWLSSIPTGYDLYIRHSSFDYDGVDNDFEDYKNDVLDWADSEGVWDDDEEDEDIEEDYEDDDDFEIEDDVSMDDVAKACFEQTAQRMAQIKDNAREMNEGFVNLCKAG